MSGRTRRKSMEDKEDVPHVSRPADTNMSSPRTRLGAESPNHIAKEELDDEDIKNLNTKKKKVKSMTRHHHRNKNERKKKYHVKILGYLVIQIK